MPKQTLSDRRQALEDRFFKNQEAKQIARLREELAQQKHREALQAASGIDDDDVLSALVKLEVGAQDLSALSLVPLLQVAWADGSISDKERSAILEAAHAQGVTEGSHGHQLLEAWLSVKPNSSLYEAWAGYASSLVGHLDEGQATSLKESILGLAHDVASAAGGILGLGSVSPAEQAVLTEIGAAFEGDAD